ncbi:uncharacterized protein LOC132538206 [Erinaceus europaeus]|uniref:Uncharacterized protein LOC132538206 n=1 Tax=Erinaceus europaeus TaxID=9365 RepID=A0ABM3XD91_ERIEU|nr:uncharacterized protein LOC132538206 [Erinaceus europaeus]
MVRPPPQKRSLKATPTAALRISHGSLRLPYSSHRRPYSGPEVLVPAYRTLGASILSYGAQRLPWPEVIVGPPASPPLPTHLRLPQYLQWASLPRHRASPNTWQRHLVVRQRLRLFSLRFCDSANQKLPASGPQRTGQCSSERRAKEIVKNEETECNAHLSAPSSRWTLGRLEEILEARLCPKLNSPVRKIKFSTVLITKIPTFSNFAHSTIGKRPDTLQDHRGLKPQIYRIPEL